MVKAKVKPDVDIVIAAAGVVNKTLTPEPSTIHEPSSEIVKHREALENIYYINDFPNEAQRAKLFSKEHLLRHINLAGYIHDDATAIHLLLSLRENIFSFYDLICSYYLRLGSIMKSSYAPDILLLVDSLNGHRTANLCVAPS
ncbi:MAG: hypothetical protein HUJ51_04175 [Eggerthellaceae bacterium]|nr:hypothetical protein [Eggerthellaceae bacterium]